jgi:hypothetical protein
VHRDTVVRFEEVLAAVPAMAAAAVTVVVGPGQVEVLDLPALRPLTERQTPDTRGVTEPPTKVPSSRCSGPKPSRCAAHWMI